MSRYDNCKCDGCDKQFTPDDDIVVCPICGTPQHRACWNKNNACVNAEKHSENFVWKNLEEENKTDNNEINNCPNCGLSVKPEMQFCPHCGCPLTNNNNRSQSQQNNSYYENEDNQESPFDTSNMSQMFPPVTQILDPYGGYSPDDTIDDIPIKEVAQTVQSNTYYYLPYFKETEKKNKLSWNWGAFIFSHLWYFYRKNYITGFLYLLIQILIGVIFANPVNQYVDLVSQMAANQATDSIIASSRALLPSLLLMVVISLTVQVIFTLIANLVYRRKVMQTIHKAKEESQSDEEFNFTLLRKGGTSFLIASLAYLGQDFLTYLLLFLSKTFF